MIRVLACGDVGAQRTQCASIFDGCRRVLQEADLCLAQLEAPISARGAKACNARLAMRAPVQMAGALHAAGFHVVSFASNHCLDFGYVAFSDTLDHATAAGLRVCGAGEDLSYARRAVLCQVGRLEVAVLGACSILPEGYAAEGSKPGCAPLRAHTLYEP